MTGPVLGLLFGVGLLLVWRSGRRRPVSPRRGPTATARVAELLAQAGMPRVRPAQLWGACAATGVAVFAVADVVSSSTVIALAFAGFASYGPVAFVKRRRRLRSTELRDIWPDVVDNLASAVRAGMSLPDAVAQLAVRGPEPLVPAFRAFADNYRASGRFAPALDSLKELLADPAADRIVESLRVAREVGGSDLGRLLRTLSQFLRDDARTRAEIETRQGWTVNAARLALVAPWVVLAMLSLRPETVGAYDTPAGVLVLVVGAGVSAGAYRLMLRIARLPVERRVLR